MKTTAPASLIPRQEEGMGVNIMRHRTELIGGTLEIQETSSLGETGVTITCKIPMQEYSNATN